MKDDTLIIIDWDDTLFPTSWIFDNRIDITNKYDKIDTVFHSKVISGYKKLSKKILKNIKIQKRTGIATDKKYFLFVIITTMFQIRHKTKTPPKYIPSFARLKLPKPANGSLPERVQPVISAVFESVPSAIKASRIPETLSL